jgi:hypothetical protein
MRQPIEIIRDPSPDPTRNTAVLLKRYANCVDGQEQAASERILAALEESEV